MTPIENSPSTYRTTFWRTLEDEIRQTQHGQFWAVQIPGINQFLTWNEYTGDMEPKVKLTEEQAWKQLEEYFNKTGSKINIPNLFQQDPGRFENFRWVSDPCLWLVGHHLNLKPTGITFKLHHIYIAFKISWSTVGAFVIPLLFTFKCSFFVIQFKYEILEGGYFNVGIKKQMIHC